MAEAGSPLKAKVNNVLTEEVVEYLLNEQGAQLSTALDKVNEQCMAGIQLVDNSELTGLNEDELDQLLLSNEEVWIKEQVQVEMNWEHLEAIVGKCVTISDICV